MASTAGKIASACSSKLAKSTIPLTILSWNICKGRASVSAPDTKQRTQESWRLIRSACLEVKPDIIALQESIDGIEVFTDLFFSGSLKTQPDYFAAKKELHDEENSLFFDVPDYKSIGTHSANGRNIIDLIVSRELAETAQRILPLSTISPWNLNTQYLVDRAPELREHDIPAVASTIQLPNNTKIAVSSIHLVPGGMNRRFQPSEYQGPASDPAAIRAYQYWSLMKILSGECQNCILIGDTNMRVSEDEDAENFDNNSWVDAWKESGSETPMKFTWNSFRNRFHRKHYGFKARYDRCYVRGAKNGGLVKVTSFGLIGNTPVKEKDGGGGDGSGDYLSDHFGIVVELDVEPTVETSDENDNGSNLLWWPRVWF